MKCWLWLFSVLMAAVALGCLTSSPSVAPPEPRDGEQHPPDTAKSPSSTQPVRNPATDPSVKKTAEEGVIRGVVLWKGTPDAAAGWNASGLTINVGGQKVPVRPEPRLVVDPQTQGVRDVAVWLENPPLAPSRAGTER